MFLFQPVNHCLLPASHYQDADKKCIVIDLDETLVHSSFKVGVILPWLMINIYKLCTSIQYFNISIILL